MKSKSKASSKSNGDLPLKEDSIIATLLAECPAEIPPAITRLLTQAPESFDDLRYGQIALAIRQLRDAGKPVGPLTVREQLDGRCEFGDVLFLDSLTVRAVSLAIAEYEAEEVWEAYRRRRIKRVYGDALSAMESDPNQADLIADRVRQALGELKPGSEGDQQAKPIGSLPAPAAEDGNELLKHRLLCRGGGLLLVGQTGQGKSSLALQMSVLWSLGRDCFGITPTRPLRVLLVQSENDDGDLYEMFTGVCAGLELTQPEIQQAGEAVLLWKEDCLSGDAFLSRVVEPLVRRHLPDLLILDPALAYVGGDTKDAEIVGQFLRRGLNPILHRYGCAVLIIHHTTKAKTDGPQTTHDFLYAGAGSIEWSNWARGVLALETKGNGCYRLHAPKRGSRIGWTDADGNPAFDCFIRHTRKHGAICWHQLEEYEIESATKSGKSKIDLMPHIPVEGTIPKTILLEKAAAAGIGQKKARALLDELIEDHTLHVWLVRRPGTNPEKRIGRQPQPKDTQITV